jgi:DNA-binding HxlR family transcriptional regulator
MSFAGLEYDRERRDHSAERLRTVVDGREPAETRASVVPHGRAGRGRGAMPRLLSDERTRTIVVALADGPCRPSQLEGLPGVAHGSLYARLAELTTHGVFAMHRHAEFPLRVEYRLSDAGRTVLANELLIERQERRRLADMGPAAGGALSNLLRLLAPVSRIGRASQGRCVFVEYEPPERASSVLLEVGDGSIVPSELGDALEDGTKVTATPDAWSEALLAGLGRGLAFVGDEVLAHTVLDSLVAALRA